MRISIYNFISLIVFVVSFIIGWLFMDLSMVFEGAVIFFLGSCYGLLWLILDEISLLNRVTNQPKGDKNNE